jgi:hypothetical protein
MAVAFAYPEPEKGGRGKKGNLPETSGFSRQRLGQARQILAHSETFAAKAISNLAPSVLHTLSQCAIFTNPPALTTSTTRANGAQVHTKLTPWIRWSPCRLTRATTEKLLRFLHVAYCWDTFVSSARDARLAHIQISIALGLHSTRGRTLSDVAAELGITKQALSRGVAKFLRMSRLEPAFGLKSTEARITYQKCH